jgi:hypothetical protein
LLASDKPDTGRLFELYLQKEDIDNFSRDFRELQIMYGPMDEDDPFNWAKFKMDTAEEVEKLEVELAKLDSKGRMVPTSGKPDKSESVESGRELALEDDVVFPSDAGLDAEETSETVDGATSFDGPRRVVMRDLETGEERLVPMEDHKILKDKDGHLWSGVILNNDTTQKITPGVRILSFRTLVVVGNARGTAGFGKGKGLTADLSLASAFRYSQRLSLFWVCYCYSYICHYIEMHFVI